MKVKDFFITNKEFILKHTASLVVVVTLVFVGLLINWVRDVSEEAIIESTFDEMNQIGKQYQILLSSTLQEANHDLQLFAEYVVKNNIDSENIVEYMNSQSQVAEFDAFYYIDLDGNGISVDNEYRNFSDNRSFLFALKDMHYVDPPRISLETSNLVFDLAIPVIKDNKTIAILFSEVSVNDFFTTIMGNKDYVGDIFFVDTNLDMIFSTSANHVGSIAIPDEDVKEMGIDNVIQAQKDIQNKQNGGFYYNYFGTPKVMVYYPLKPTNVALAMNVHVDSLSSEIIEASENFNLVGVIVYWTVVALVIYISIMQYRSKKNILRVAYCDPLTKLPNLVKFKLELDSALKNNPEKEYTIMILDIDNFKAINEIFGYEMGDRVLKAVKGFTDTLNEPSLIVARISGDKFAICAESFVLEDVNTFFIKGMTYYDIVLPELKDYAGTYKVGRYKIEKGETNADEIISKASLAHNKAKATKGDFLCDYDDMFKKTIQIEAEITNKMYSALRNGEFRPFLQPKFSISEDRLVGAEALVRWFETDDKMIYPSDFIPLFERNGFIVEVDKYILEQVCITIRRWLDKGLDAIPISVNFSRLNLQSSNFVSSIVAIADKHNVPHQLIEVELTESTTIESELTIEQIFEGLRNEGFKVSIDDFGAGYSSLSMLKNLHLDTLKMDRSFFISSKNANRDDMLIDSIIKMAQSLKMYVVAEGIETAEQINLLKTMNCDAVQGYFYSKPISIAQFEEKYISAMLKNSEEVKHLPLIKHINDIRYAISVVPSGMIVTKTDDYFTIVEANDYFFEMIGHTREELRTLYNNWGIALMLPESRKEVFEYFKKQMEMGQDRLMEITAKFMLKDGKIYTYKLNGKVDINEKNEALVYASVADITRHL